MPNSTSQDDKNTQDALLLVRCPSCRQRFKVSDDLRGRMVECGACEHRFQIEGGVVMRGRKVYPGERAGPLLDRFQRVPHSGAAFGLVGQTVSYGPPPDPVELETVAPQRVIAGAAGVLVMIFVALLLMFGASRGGALDGMPMVNRFALAGFTSLMGMIALVYANPKARAKAFLVSLLLGCGVSSVPIFFQEGAVALGAGAVKTETPEARPWLVKNADESEIAVLRGRIGTGPLEAEITRLAGVDGQNTRAIGLWLRGLSNNHKYLVRDYILRVTKADPASHAYPRDGGDYLFLVTGITQTMDQMAELVAPFGEIVQSYPDLSVIEVRVNNENFVEAPIEKLQLKDDPDYYTLNKRELESIDLERVKRAVQRLAKAEPKIYRTDIARKLMSLLSEADVDFKGNVCEALVVWADKPGPASEAAYKELKLLMDRNAQVPPEMVALLVKEKHPHAVAVLDQLWFGAPATWESLFGDLGAGAEAKILSRLPETSGSMRHSAVRILGRIGGRESLNLLEEIVVGSDSELRVLIQQSEKAIVSRLGE
jgi:predicted Zn finger-like uncharacterized protein